MLSSLLIPFLGFDVFAIMITTTCKRAVLADRFNEQRYSTYGQSLHPNQGPSPSLIVVSMASTKRSQD
jgi:hypothetical protein